jgi:phosphoribosylaminoimidazole (AIR) synthetase
MLSAWNCGVGLAVVIPAADARGALETLAGKGHAAWEIGVVEKGDGGVLFA